MTPAENQKSTVSRTMAFAAARMIMKNEESRNKMDDSRGAEVKILAHEQKYYFLLSMYYIKKCHKERNRMDIFRCLCISLVRPVSLSVCISVALSACHCPAVVLRWSYRGPTVVLLWSCYCPAMVLLVCLLVSLVCLLSWSACQLDFQIPCTCQVFVWSAVSVHLPRVCLVCS